MWSKLAPRAPSAPSSEPGLPEPGPPEPGPPEPGPREIGPPEIGKSDLGLSEMRNPRLRISQLRKSHLRISDLVGPHAWPAAVGLGLGLLALGPALGRGFVLSYDMVFVPAPPISSADFGFTGEPARAVPSDLTVALVAKIIPAELVQKMILLAIFMLACAGAAALLASGWQRRNGGGPGKL